MRGFAWRYWRRIAIALGVGFVGCVGIGGCDAPLVDGADRSSPSSVFIEATARLAGPQVGQSSARQPSRWIEVSLDDRSVWVADFEVTVATDQPQRLKARLATFDNGAPPAVLSRIAPPPSQSNDSAQMAIESNVSLCAETGCFWVEDESSPVSALSKRIGVLIPDSQFDGIPWLELFVSQTDDGDPILADRVQLTRSFFYMAAMGDSIMWGNGLRNRDKFTTLTAKTIERQTSQKVVSTVLAVSGAEIVPPEEITICDDRCSGEAPNGVTPIILQPDFLERPELLDLILLDGCANDVGLPAILSPLTDPAELAQATDLFCEVEMTGLLRKVRSLTEQTPIIVTGYFQFVSDGSLELGAEELAIIQGVARDDLDEIEDPLAALVTNSVIFDQRARVALAEAVATVNADRADDGLIAFADPGFTADNAVFAAQSWLWNLTFNDELLNLIGVDLRLFPEDPLVEFRIQQCTQPGTIPDLISCIYGSLAHPNPAGARAYADAIARAMREIGVLGDGESP